MTTKPLDLSPWLGDIAQSLLGIDTLATRGRDALDFHDVGVSSLREALEAAVRMGYAAGQAGLPIAPHVPSFDDNPKRGVDRLTPLFTRHGLNPAGLVEPGHPQSMEEYQAQRQAEQAPRRRRSF